MDSRSLRLHNFKSFLACLHFSAEELYCYMYTPGVRVGVSVRVCMQNVRANVKVMEFQSLFIFCCILTLLIILIKPLTTKAHDRRASGECGTSGPEGFITVAIKYANSTLRGVRWRDVACRWFEIWQHFIEGSIISKRLHVFECIHVTCALKHSTRMIRLYTTSTVSKDLKECKLSYTTVKHLYFAWPYFRELTALDIFTRLYFRDIN